ncbi:MAG: CocE/NonD family hydrolase [Chloroflexota bacterium]|nr:CocE/NonD family hydrolase [Chloroflexota bacterium]
MPQFGIHVFRDVMVPMRDGVHLATDIHLPALNGQALDGPFPTILGRTSYNKSDPTMWVRPVAEFFVPLGYAVVLQDLRGRYKSEGTGQYFHVANVNEGCDGFDTVEWIARQPWSTGRIGTLGSSHNGIVQLQMALLEPEHLVAIWPDVTPTNSYAHVCRDGGAMAMHVLGHLFLHGHDSQEIRDKATDQQAFVEAMEEFREWVWRTPFKPGQTPLALVPNLEKTLFDYYYRGAYDEWWAQECLDRTRFYHKHKDIPGTYSGGWFDPLSTSTTTYFMAMAQQNTTPQRLLMGPWTHQGMTRGMSYAGDVEFGPDARWGIDRYNAERLRWFDRWLKGIANGVEDDPPVRIFVMGGGDGHRTAQGRMYHGGAWRSENEWPLARTRYTPYYLGSGGLVATDRGEPGAAPARYAFDPTHPVPTLGANVCAFYEMVPVGEGMNAEMVVPRARMRSIVTEGPTHQKEAPGVVGARPPYPTLAERSDVLVFQTPVLTEDIEVTGHVVAELWVSSSAVDTDFTAKLIDVYPGTPDYPSGYHMGLVDSILRARFRDGFEVEHFMTPGEIYQVTIQLGPVSSVFKTGHRLRVDISSSNFPRFDVNPNTGEPMGRHTHCVIAHNAVYVDDEHPSHVVLPIIP